MENYFPSPHWVLIYVIKAVQNYRNIVQGYQMFDYVLVLLLLTGTKAGPFLLML